MRPRLQKHRASPATAREIVASVGATRDDLAAVEKALRAVLSEPSRGRGALESKELNRALAALAGISTPIRGARPATSAAKSRAQTSAAAKSPPKESRKPRGKNSTRPTAAAAGRRGTPGPSPRKAGRP
jgi:hypothetical protein